jgi:amino acid transporter
MVGAGIFAMMGEAAALAGSAVWISFALAGVIALLTGHSFVQLGILYPSRGGVVDYLSRAYGEGRFSGACSILFYFAQLIGMAMIALAFGKFATALLGVQSNPALSERLLGSGLIIVLSLLAVFGSKIIAQIQRKVVLANLLLLGGFTIALAPQVDVNRLAVSTWPSGNDVLGSLALTFFAFTGFAVISNAAERLSNPSRDLPRAMVGAIGIVMLLYVAMALAITGVVSEQQLTVSAAKLLPVAAQTQFGDIGYRILLISAVLSTFTCLNGGLFGVTSITFSLATKGQLPQRFGQQIRASTRGLTISAVSAIALLNFFSLSTIASLGSATSIFVYTLVNIGALRLVRHGGMTKVLIVLSVISTLLATLVWVGYHLDQDPYTLAVFLLFLALAVLVESFLKRPGPLHNNS